MTATGHEERQTDRHSTRPQGRSPKAAGSGQGTIREQTRDMQNDMDRSTMQSEVGIYGGRKWA